LLWTQKQYEEAAQKFQAELDNIPNYSQAIAYLADSEIQMNQLDKARAHLEPLVESDSKLFMAWLDLGIVDAESGRDKKAEHELVTAEKMKPNDIDVHWRLGRLYRSMSMLSRANFEFAKARSLNKAADDSLLDVLTTTPDKKTNPVK
jgi:tetratricopeptide (TPR) repeat protein